jgi:hypothetical protein
MADELAPGYLDAETVAELLENGPGEGMSMDEELLPMEVEPPVDSSLHEANLAEVLEEDYLDRLAMDVIDWVDEDLSSRDGWDELVANGIRELGLNPQKVKRPEDWMTPITHPLVKESLIQFGARAIAELWPKEGPASAKVLGDSTEELEMQAIRVSHYLNYLYQHDMPGAFEEKERLILWAGFSGSAFEKAYFCPITRKVSTYTIHSDNFIVPYVARDLLTAERYTERYWDTKQDRDAKTASGLYRELDGDYRGDSTRDHSDVQEEIDEGEGRAQINWTDDETFNTLETNCYLKLPELDDEAEVARPYVVVVDRVNSKVLSIRRAWREGDPLHQRRILITHYKFLPGFGFYGWGLIHIVGDLGASATQALRELLDAGYLANAPGGFTSRHSRIDGNIKVIPAVYQRVDVEPDEIKNAFVNYPFKEPSPTLLKLMDYVDGLGRRVASTTEAMVGENSPGTPVGTTMALIEQGSKVISGVHKRMHKALGEELKIVAELCAEHLPPVYPYYVHGQDRGVKQTDFDARVDVIPSSDPEVISGAQRIAMAQTLIQLLMQFPENIKRDVVVHRVVTLLRLPEPEDLLVDNQPPPRMDPVSEGVAMLKGQPVQTYPEQDHAAHIAIHTELWKALDKETVKARGPAIWAHVMEHGAESYRQQIEQQAGITAQQLEIPGIEQMLTQIRISPLFPFRDEAEEEIKDYEVLRKEARQDMALERRLQRDDVKAEAILNRQTESQAAAVAGQRMQNDEALMFTQAMHDMKLQRQEYEMQMKRMDDTLTQIQKLFNVSGGERNEPNRGVD